MKTSVNGEKMAKFYLDKKSWAVKAAVILMLISAVFRFIGSWGLWSDKQFIVGQLILPLLSCLMFVAFLLLLGGKALWLTSVPVILGAVFFIIKALDYENKLRMVLSIIFYAAGAVLYTATVFGFVKNKWFLVPLFGLPVIYNIFFLDIPALRNTAEPVTFSAGMQEMSVLCILIAMLITALGIKKKKVQLEDAELPKMKAPVVKTPEKPEKPGEETKVMQPEKPAPEKQINSEQGEKL